MNSIELVDGMICSNSTAGLVAVTPAATPQRTQSSASLGSVSAVSVAGTPAQRTPAPSAWPSAAGRKLGRGRLAPPRGKIPAPQERSSSRPAASRVSRAARKAVVAAGRRDGGVSWVPSPSSPSLFSLSLGEPVPVALTGGSDPILAEMFHGVDSTTHTLFVGVRATNGTRAHLPPMTCVRFV